MCKNSIVGMPVFFGPLLATRCLPTPSFFRAEEIADLILWHWLLLQFVTFVSVLFMSYKRYTYSELIQPITGKVFKMNVRVKVMICGGGKANFYVVGTEVLLVTLNFAHSATVVICWCLHYGCTVPDAKLLYWRYRRTRHTHDYNLFNVTFLSLWDRHYSRDREVTHEVNIR